jgi:hypothetical protein
LCRTTSRVLKTRSSRRTEREGHKRELLRNSPRRLRARRRPRVKHCLPVCSSQSRQYKLPVGEKILIQRRSFANSLRRVFVPRVKNVNILTICPSRERTLKLITTSTQEPVLTKCQTLL